MSLGTMEQKTEGIKKQAQQLIEQAYYRGFKTGREDRQDWEKDQVDRLVEQGMNMAWECILKIVGRDTNCGCLSQSQLYEIFGEIDYRNIVLHNSPNEAIERIREYEEKQKQKEDSEIHVGDEVRNDDVEAVVTWCDGKYWNGFLLKGEGVGEVGQVYSCMSCNEWKKTGRTFHQIAEVLKKLQEDEKE